MKLGSIDITNFTFASLGSSKLYLGGEQVWPLGSPGPSLDPDAEAFLIATGLLGDPTIEPAINTLVLELKAANIWTKMQAIYPFVGGTAATNAVNLKEPGTFDWSWFGGVTHNANGVTFNGTNGYGRAAYVADVQAIQNNTHMSIYSRTDVARVAGDFSASNFSQADRMNMVLRWTDNNSYHDFYSFVSNRMVRSVTDSLGQYIITRTASNDFRLIKNNVQLGATITAVTGNVANIDGDLYIGAQARGNSFIGLNQYSNRNYAFASIGRGLIVSECTDLTNIIQTFQTTLGRQV